MSGTTSSFQTEYRPSTLPTTRAAATSSNGSRILPRSPEKRKRTLEREESEYLEPVNIYSEPLDAVRAAPNNAPLTRPYPPTLPATNRLSKRSVDSRRCVSSTGLVNAVKKPWIAVNGFVQKRYAVLVCLSLVVNVIVFFMALGALARVDSAANSSCKCPSVTPKSDIISGGGGRTNFSRK